MVKIFTGNEEIVTYDGTELFEVVEHFYEEQFMRL